MTDHGILFQPAMVRVQLARLKTQTRRVVAPSNCTVNGSRVRASSPAWKGLLFDHPRTIVRTRSTMMQAVAGPDAPYDLHLDVPFLHPEDAAAGRKWEDDECFYRVRPIVQRGDRLWVRESAWYDPEVCRGLEDRGLRCFFPGRLVRFEDGGWGTSPFGNGDEILKLAGLRRKPGIHMPRWASRLTWSVTDVRLQRLHAIDEADAQAEGALRMSMDDEAKFYETPDGGSYRCGFAGIWAHINGRDSWDANPWIVAYTGDVANRNIDA